MKKNDWFITFGLFFIGILSRMPFIEHFQSHWDGPQYSIAVVRYSFLQDTPAPPGYPLYIGIGKFINFFTHNPHLALLLESVLWSGLGGAVLYAVGNILFGKKAGLTASLIFLTGSTFYYFGLTPYAYLTLPVTGTLLFYSVYSIVINKKQWGIPLGIIFGICLAIRPQEALQIAPLFLLGWFFLQRKQKLTSFLIVMGVTAMWFFIIVSITGGLSQYLAISDQAAQGAIPAFSLLNPLKYFEINIKGVLLSLGLFGILLLYYPFLLFKKNHFSKKTLVFLFFLIPGMVFNFFIRSDHAGYQMTYITALIFSIAYATEHIFKKHTKLFYGFLIVCSVFNLAVFFINRDPSYTKPYRPTSFHYSDIRKNDLKLGSKVTYIQSHFDPKTTLLITTDTLWRPYMYHLKNYHLLALDALDIIDPKYKYLTHQAYQWNKADMYNFSLMFAIPSKFTTVIFLDDDARNWIHTNHSTYALPGNGYLTRVSPTSLSQITYTYHTITVQ